MDVCRAVKKFFYDDQIPEGVNATTIALVPKLDTPLKVYDFRPIACCNVLYKCISKIITTRIKTVLGNIVNKNQSAFIPGRHISDNILVAQELMREYDRKYGVSRCALKIDLQNAYDTINREFLESCLVGFGFPEKMISWILACVTGSKFSLNINGELHGFFQGARGLRQGDPMSPYLFTLVMEVFTLIAKRQVSESGLFKYHWGCNELQLTHLCFADDLLMVCYGDVNSVQVVKLASEEFSSVSGLYPNLSKSTVFFRECKGRSPIGNHTDNWICKRAVTCEILGCSSVL